MEWKNLRWSRLSVIKSSRAHNLLKTQQQRSKDSRYFCPTWVLRRGDATNLNYLPFAVIISKYSRCCDSLKIKETCCCYHGITFADCGWPVELISLTVSVDSDILQKHGNPCSGFSQEVFYPEFGFARCVNSCDTHFQLGNSAEIIIPEQSH